MCNFVLGPWGFVAFFVVLGRFFVIGVFNSDSKTGLQIKIF